MLRLCSSIPVGLFKTLATRWRQKSAPVLIIYMYISGLTDTAWQTLLIFLLDVLHTGEAVSSWMSRSPHVGPSHPSGTRPRFHTCLLIWHQEWAERKRTEDTTPSLFTPIWETDFLPMLLWSLFHSVSLIHTTSLASFCPQSFLTGSFFPFLLPLTLEQMNNSLWWSRLQKPHAWRTSLRVCQIGRVI